MKKTMSPVIEVWMVEYINCVKGGLILAILSALRRGQCAEVRSIKKLIRELTFILNLIINLCR